MKKIFITYADSNFEVAKNNIILQAKATNEFDEIYAYGRSDISLELKKSEVINIERGGGLWSWKPDVILTTMLNHEVGDVVVYCDAGCSLYPSKEWAQLWEKLYHFDIIAHKTFHRTDKWTKKKVLDFFRNSTDCLESRRQFEATVITLVISEFTLKLIREWRDIMIEKPELVKDVSKSDLHLECDGFIENRHDQAIYSALIYKYMSNNAYSAKIYTMWEHTDDYDPFKKQAIRSTRFRNAIIEKNLWLQIIKRIIKHQILKPLLCSPFKYIVDKIYK